MCSRRYYYDGIVLILTLNINMKVYWLLILVFIVSCGRGKKYHDEKEDVRSGSPEIAEILEFQKEMNTTFQDPETSPLPDRFRKDFETLSFFEPNLSYRIEAKFERTPEAVPFLMSTNTDEKSEEVLYGIAYFVLNGAEHQLEIYQTPGLLDQKKYEDYLFLPFLDDTNGVETYAGGRYIDLTIPKGNSIVIDFNKAYNPYCVYNKKYSCPLVPKQNYLRTHVRAGVKDFKKE